MPRLANEQHEAFAHHYLEDFNAINAMVAAGIAEADVPKAELTGRCHILMMRPDVSSRVRELHEALLRKVDATASRTMRELARISFSDVRRLFDDDGRMKRIEDIDKDTAASIKAVKIERRRQKNGYETDLVTGKKTPVYDEYETVEIKMHDKVTTLGILAKHFKIVGDEADGVNALASALADRLKGARQRVLATPRALPAPYTTGSGHEEITDARIIHTDVSADPVVSRIREAVQESGNGYRSDA